MRKDITAEETNMYAVVAQGALLIEFVRDPRDLLTAVGEEVILNRLHDLLGGARDAFSEEMWVGGQS